MELKEAKCPNCGGLLKLNPELEKGTCIYCGTEFVVSEAIQKFQGEVSGIATTKSSLIRAQNSIEDGDYDEAMKILKHVIDTEPTNPDAYYEMFLCSLDVAEYYKRQHEGQERTLPQYIDDLHDALQKYGRRAVQYARDENEKAKFQQGISDLENKISSCEQALQERSKKRGCYVATAVYGSYDCPEVWTLRRYRDYTLDRTWYGRMFIRTYYAVSPTLVKWFGDTDWFKKMWRGKLDHMVTKLNDQGFGNTPYNDKY